MLWLQANSFSEAPDLVDRVASHTRSFSSEKIFQDFRELQRQSQGLQAAAAAGLAAASTNGASRDSVPVRSDGCMLARSRVCVCVCVACPSFRKRNEVLHAQDWEQRDRGGKTEIRGGRVMNVDPASQIVVVQLPRIYASCNVLQASCLT